MMLPGAIPPKGRSLASICVTAVLVVLSTVVVCTRLWVRNRARKRAYLDWDDILALLGLVSFPQGPPSPPPPLNGDAPRCFVCRVGTSTMGPARRCGTHTYTTLSWPTGPFYRHQHCYQYVKVSSHMSPWNPLGQEAVSRPRMRREREGRRVREKRGVIVEMRGIGHEDGEGEEDTLPEAQAGKLANEIRYWP